MTGSRFVAVIASSLLLILPARGEDILRIAMTASDIPTTNGIDHAAVSRLAEPNMDRGGFAKCNITKKSPMSGL